MVVNIKPKRNVTFKLIALLNVSNYKNTTFLRTRGYDQTLKLRYDYKATILLTNIKRLPTILKGYFSEEVNKKYI